MTRRASKKRKAAHPLHLLIDTCVWLDLAKDYRQLTLLGALEELVGTGEVVLIVPETVKDEFARNKARIAEESGRSLSGVLKRVKEAVDQFGTPEAKATTLAQLNDIDHRIVTLGESVNASLRRIEALLGAALTLPMTDSIKLRAAQRAIDKRAPFHRQRRCPWHEIRVRDAQRQGLQ